MEYNKWAFHDIEPVYLQLIHKIKYAILSKRLSAGESLPSVREMANLLRISSNTVQKAYNHMHHLGLIASTSNKHYSVIANESYILQKRDEEARELCCQYLSNMISLGLSKNEAVDFLIAYSSKLKEPSNSNL